MLREPEGLPAGVYGLAIASYFRDGTALAEGKHNNILKISRIFVSTVIILSVAILQVFLTYEALTFVAPRNIMKAREAYGAFEEGMYKDEQGYAHIHMSANNFPRGNDGYFHINNFDKMEKHEKDLACRIPLAHPHFLFAILFIWTITCTSEVRQTMALILRLAFAVETSSTMRGALEYSEETKQYTIRRATCCMKFVCCLILIPRACIAVVLLWVGCRWLISTIGFGDLLLNAVALEFILGLRELLFNALVPLRLQTETENTLVPHLSAKEPATCSTYFGMFFLGVLAFAWVYAYVYYIQAVLPGYKFDVRAACMQYLAHELHV